MHDYTITYANKYGMPIQCSNTFCIRLVNEFARNKL
jgi:hypothetical protein